MTVQWLLLLTYFNVDNIAWLFVDLSIHFPIYLHDMHRDHVCSLLTSMGAHILKESNGKIRTLHCLNCASWYTCVRKTNKMHTFLNNLFHFKLSSTCFKQVIVHHKEEFCTSSLQHFTMYLKRSLVADTIWMIICIMSAARFLLRYIVKYCKLFLQNSSWWWTITCLKHIEDNLSEIDY
jgi:hypothetical protein